MNCLLALPLRHGLQGTYYKLAHTEYRSRTPTENGGSTTGSKNIFPVYVELVTYVGRNFQIEGQGRSRKAGSKGVGRIGKVARLMKAASSKDRWSILLVEQSIIS
jgi:hypothetical protein